MKEKHTTASVTTDFPEDFAASTTVPEDTITESFTDLVKHKNGVVANCNKLNVRTMPSKDSDVVTVIDAGTKVDIVSDANEDFYEIQVMMGDGGILGYCMKAYVNVED